LRSDGNKFPKRPDRPDRGDGRLRPPGARQISEETDQAEAGRRLPAFLQKFQDWLDARAEDAVVEPEKIELGTRLMAFGIDFGAAFFVSMLVMMIPFVNKVLTQNLVLLTLMCVRDYFYGGRGLGKNIMGLRVVDIFTGQEPSLRAAVTRNFFYLGPLLILEVLQFVLRLVPAPQLTFFIGQVATGLAGLYVLVILPVECYRSVTREDSMRLGDEIAGTCVIEAETDFSSLMRN
jgi:uncharacterized RDD family membrane protein YckC